MKFVYCFAIVALFPLTCWGDIYIAEQFTGFETGWSFDGGYFDVQDGFEGDINSSSNLDAIIPEFSLAFTSPAGSYELNQNNSSLLYSGNIFNVDLRITQEAIEFPEAQDTLDVFFARSNSGPLLDVGFLTPGTVGNLRESLSLTDFNIAPGGATSRSSSSLSPSGPLRIATAVPEPSCSMIILAIFANLALGRRGRRQ